MQLLGAWRACVVAVGRVEGLWDIYRVREAAAWCMDGAWVSPRCVEGQGVLLAAIGRMESARRACSVAVGRMEDARGTSRVLGQLHDAWKVCGAPVGCLE